MLDPNNHTLDKNTAVLLSYLSARGFAAIRLIWRHHFSGGAVLQDIGGRVVTRDEESAANNKPRARQWGFISLISAGRTWASPSPATGAAGCDHLGLREADSGIGASRCGDCGAVVGRRL